MGEKSNLSTYLAALSLIIGLPGFIAACSLGYWGYGILALVIAGLLWGFRWLLRLPTWTIIELKRTLKITRKNGSFAAFKKEMTIRANHKGITRFAYRNIRADGSINNFRLNSLPVSDSDIENRAGEFIVYERFNQPMRWRQARKSILEYNLLNSYPSSTESTTYAPDYPTKICKIEVILPRWRPARSPRAYMGIGAEIISLNNPSLSTDGRTINWEGKKLQPGKLYTVEWDW